MIETKGASNQIAIIKTYTKDLRGLKKSLENLYQYLENNTMKARFTLLQKKMGQYLNGQYLNDNDSTPELAVSLPVAGEDNSVGDNL